MLGVGESSRCSPLACMQAALDFAFQPSLGGEEATQDACGDASGSMMSIHLQTWNQVVVQTGLRDTGAARTIDRRAARQTLRDK